MSNTKVVTGPVRLSYVHVFEPYSSDPEEEKKYSAMLLIPKTDTATIDAINAAFAAAAEIGKAKHFGGKVPKNLNTTLRDGDEEYDIEERPEFAGMMFMNTSSKRKPGVVDKAAQPIMDDTEVYSGCWARVALNAFAFSGKKTGVSMGLNHVMKWKDDEPLGGVPESAEDAFADIVSVEDEAASLI